MEKWIGEAALREREEASFEELEGAMDRAVKQTEDNLRLYQGAFPEANSVGGFYPTGKNTDWTSGFWTGELWISYDYEKDPEKKSFLLSEGRRRFFPFPGGWRSGIISITTIWASSSSPPVSTHGASREI